MKKLKLDLTGKDSVFLSNSYRIINGLSNLDLFRVVPEKVPNLEHLKEGLAKFQQPYEAAKNGDRVQQALRNQARKELTEMFKKVLHYLQSVTTEDDIPQLLQAGFEVYRTSSRKKADVSVATG